MPLPTYEKRPDEQPREEEKRQRGRLKIFFGACSGAGKTFAMLQAARRCRDEGVEVVVGVAETHGRKETLALLEGLETLPPARVDYRGGPLAEFDLDAALQRKPQLILVDELAHANVQGSRHMKRWQDVRELLDAGIDVYTTVNVQHLESLNDIVGRITGIRVQETVPDRVFDLADEVTLVDLPPEGLLERLREGKVYLPQQAEHAGRNFFRKGNLIALRELAQRRTAERGDARTREERADPSVERIVGPRPEIDATPVSTSPRDTERRPLIDASGTWRDDAHSPPRAYLQALAIGAGITLVADLLAARHFANTNLVMLYLLGVIFAAARLGRGPGVMLSFLSVAAFDFFFVPPMLSFSVTDTQYLLTFAVMLLTSLTISHLTSSFRREARLASQRERRTAAMYAMTRELAAALTTEQIIEIGTRHVAGVFQAKVAMLLPDAAEKMRQNVDQSSPDITLDTGRLELAVAQWVYDQQKPAGRGTDTLPASEACYLPLKAPTRTRGVLAFVTERASELAAPEQWRMIETFAAQIALALERVHYVEIARDALVDIESERLRNSLLSAISHDLRTPLTSIVGFASVLEEQAGAAGGGPEASQELVHAIHEEALRMSGLVTNLLDMARLQAGAVRLNRQWSTLEESVGAALASSRRVLAGRAVQVRIPPDLPLLRLDAVLMERLFANLLENAAKYTPPMTPIRISAALEHEGEARVVRVCLDDEGPGVPSGLQSRLFDKFTRGEKESAQPGIGLGLAICRAIVKAHGGSIGVGNREDRGERVAGARFWFTLPANDAPPEDVPPDEESESKVATPGTDDV